MGTVYMCRIRSKVDPQQDRSRVLFSGNETVLVLGLRSSKQERLRSPQHERSRVNSANVWYSGPECGQGLRKKRFVRHAIKFHGLLKSIDFKVRGFVRTVSNKWTKSRSRMFLVRIYRMELTGVVQAWGLVAADRGVATHPMRSIWYEKRIRLEPFWQWSSLCSMLFTSSINDLWW